MPWKDVRKRREAVRKHYYANRQAYIDKAAKRKKTLREYVHKIKEKAPCHDCRKRFPYYVMDFDHVRGIKDMTISRMINQGNANKINDEMKKCELVCSNCHRIRTHKRKTVEGTV